MKRYNPANIMDFYFDFIGEFPDAAKLDAIFDAHGINPHGVTGVTAGDVTGDGREEIIGTGSNGIYYYNVAKSEWTSMSSYPTTETSHQEISQVTAGQMWPPYGVLVFGIKMVQLSVGQR